MKYEEKRIKKNGLCVSCQRADVVMKCCESCNSNMFDFSERKELEGVFLGWVCAGPALAKIGLGEE